MFLDTSHEPPWRQRVAAYAVILRKPDGLGEQVLLSRLAPYLTPAQMWTLPGGGVEFGEHPREAVVREVYEEAGLAVQVGEIAWIDSAMRRTRGARMPETDMHSVRMVFEGWVPGDSPPPRVVEVDGSTVDARWHPVAEVLSGAVPTVPTVRAALAALHPPRRQRLAAYGLVRRGDTILLTRISGTGFGAGTWHLPGGGVDHGERPADAVAREIREEAGVAADVGALLGVHDVHVTEHAPDGRLENFHGVHLVFAAAVAGDAVPQVTENDGTTDAVAWIRLADIEAGTVEVTGVVSAALAWLA